jgi:small GTP-binding protein
MSGYTYLFKYIIIGDSACGKSCLLLQFTNKQFYSKHELTIGVEFGSYIINLDNTKIKIQIWDTTGQEIYKSITRSYYKGSAAAILVYDITKRSTFNNIISWLNDCKQYGSKNICIMLVGNKIDMNNKREVSYNEGLTLAKAYGLSFLETSAKTNTNVDTIFISLAHSINNKINSGVIDVTDTNNGIKIGNGCIQQNNNNNILINIDHKDNKICCK